VKKSDKNPKVADFPVQPKQNWATVAYGRATRAGVEKNTKKATDTRHLLYWGFWELNGKENRERGDEAKPRTQRGTKKGLLWGNDIIGRRKARHLGRKIGRWRRELKGGKRRKGGGQKKKNGHWTGIAKYLGAVDGTRYGEKEGGNKVQKSRRETHNAKRVCWPQIERGKGA